MSKRKNNARHAFKHSKYFHCLFAESMTGSSAELLLTLENADRSVVLEINVYHNQATGDVCISSDDGMTFGERYRTIGYVSVNCHINNFDAAVGEFLQSYVKKCEEKERHVQKQLSQVKTFISSH